MLHWCYCVLIRFLWKLYPPGASSFESGASVRAGFCCTVSVLPRGPALDARCAMAGGAFVLHSYELVWTAPAEALPPRSIVY